MKTIRNYIYQSLYSENYTYRCNYLATVFVFRDYVFKTIRLIFRGNNHTIFIFINDLLVAKATPLPLLVKRCMNRKNINVLFESNS